MLPARSHDMRDISFVRGPYLLLLLDGLSAGGLMIICDDYDAAAR